MRALFTAALLAATALCAAPAIAQSPAVELATDSGKFDQLIGLSKQSIMSNPPEALKLATEAEIAAGNSVLRLAEAKWLKGEALKRMHQGDAARAEIDEALTIVEGAASNTKLHADLLRTNSGIAKHEGDYASALRSLHQAHDIYAKIGEARSQAITLQQTGSIYNDARQYDRVVSYYERAGHVWSNDIALDLARLNNVANAYIELGEFKKAEEGYRAALVIAEEIEAVQLQAQILTNIAHAQAQDGQIGFAQVTLDKARALTLTEEGRGWAMFVAGVDAEIAYLTGDLNRAVESIGIMFEGVDIGDTDMFFCDFHELAFNIFEAVGDNPTALNHLQAFKRLDDDARDVAASANTALLSAEFDFATQKLEIANLRAETLEQEVEIKEAQARQRTLIFSGSSIIALVVIIGLGGSYNSIRRSRNRVRAANDQLSTTNNALEKALKAKSEFLATTSHEIRTPLNGIIGMTEILLRGEKLEPGTLDRVEAIHGSSQTMKAIVDDILDVSKMEGGVVTINPEEFSLQKTLKDVERVWRDSATNKGLELSLDAENCADRIVMDPQRLRQIAFNLSSNAIKFTETGKVELTCRTETIDGSDWLELVVTDTGIGIPQDELEAIFEPFHQVDGGTTRAQGGTGLGLTICRNFARAMGGDVSVKSTLGEGASFTLRVPVEIVSSATEASDEEVVVAIESNLMKQHLYKALFMGREEPLICVADTQSALDALKRVQASYLVASVSDLGEGPGDMIATLMTLRKGAPNAKLIIFCDVDWASSPMLKISGVDQVIEGGFDSTALLNALNKEESATQPLSA